MARPETEEEKEAKRTLKWDHRFLRMAREIATWSKDPSTQVGAVIVHEDKTIVSLGYNGFPRGIEDSVVRLRDRTQKMSLIIHAEMNALLNSTASISGCWVYVWPLPPCADCAKHLVQAGVARVISVSPPPENVVRMGPSLLIAANMFKEVGIDYTEYESVNEER